MLSTDSLAHTRSPGTLAIEVTSRCDRSCSYCYNAWKVDPDYPQGELPASELISLVNKVVIESGITAIQITGGEPLLRPDILDIIEGIRAPGRSISLVTDGGLIDDTLATEFRRLGVGPVQPTLLAANAGYHNALKGTQCFDETMAGIASLLRCKVPVSVSFVCTKENYSHFEETVELCFALGIKVVAFSRLCAAGEGGRNYKELMPTAKMIQHCLQVAEQANERMGMNVIIAISLPLCAFDISHYPHLRFGRCAVSNQTPGFTIDPIGGLRACSISSTRLGNLLEESWDTVLSRAAEEYFKEMTEAPTECQGCSMLARCGGGCRESALTYYGDPDHLDPLVGG
jgi:radical SAM protein with 4Fe4S-binding SPASM domain